MQLAVIRKPPALVGNETPTSIWPEDNLLNRDDTYSAFMLDHVAGNHPAALSLAADVHMLLSAQGAATAQAWTLIGGALLETDGASARDVVAPHRLTDGRSRRKANTVAAIKDADIAWRRDFVSGAFFAPVGQARAKFMKLHPGQNVPEHNHAALEVTVVLRGKFSDGHGTYARGDLVLGERGLKHRPSGEGDETCVCLVAEAPFNWREWLR